MTQDMPIAILYEHPRWFGSLFAALDRRGIKYERLSVRDHLYDPADRSSPYRLVLNRVSAYDINPLSNFVANATRVVGFDPTEKVVDLLLQRAASREPSE